MNIGDFNHLATYGRPLKQTFNLNLSSFDYVLENKFKLGNNPANQSVPVAADFKDNYLVIAQDDGHINLMNSNRMYSITRFQAQNNTILDLRFRPNHTKQILSASGDRSIRIWDLENEKFTNQIDCGQCTIKTLNFYDSNIFVTGGRDGFIRLWDLRSETQLIKSIKDAHRNNLKSSKKVTKRSGQNKWMVSDPNSIVTSVIFDNHNYLYSAGANDGCIKIWDLRSLNSNTYNHLIYLQKLEYCGLNEKAEGFTSLALDSKHQLYASCSDHKIYSYDYRGSVGIKQEAEYVKAFKGASITNYTRIKILNDDLLLSGSREAEVCVWSLNKAKHNCYNYPQIKLPHSMEEVSLVQCNDSNYEIFSCDDTTNVFKWKINSKLNDRTNKKGKISVECDEMLEEKVTLGKPRKVLSPKHSIMNLHQMTTGVKRPFSFMTKAQ